APAVDAAARGGSRYGVLSSNGGIMRGLSDSCLSGPQVSYICGITVDKPGGMTSYHPDKPHGPGAHGRLPARATPGPALADGGDDRGRARPGVTDLLGRRAGGSGREPDPGRGGREAADRGDGLRHLGECG